MINYVFHAAKSVLVYYEMLDSDTEHPDYHKRVQAIRAVVTNKFGGYSIGNNTNPVINLFLILNALHESSIACSGMNLDSASDDLDKIHLKLDATLRALVTQLTGVDIKREDVEIDQDFVTQFSIEPTNILRPVFFKKTK